MKTIVFFTSRMTSGGSERVISYLANGLCKKYNIVILTMTCAKSDYDLDSRVKHIVLERKKAMNNHSIITNIKRIHNFSRFVSENKYATYISFVTLPNYLLLLFRSKIKGKIITAIRNDPKEMHKHFYDKLLVKFLFPKSDAFAFQTKEAELYYDKLNIKNKIILPNPINEKFLRKPYDGTREKIITNVGRLIEQKNQELLINSFKKVHEKHKDFKLYIYGIGKLENKLIDLINNLNLQEYVELKGSCSNLEIELYNKYLFVLSSKFEGLPNALLEAMSLGVTSISTNCSGGGPASIINNNVNGILVPSNDEKALTNAINYCIENEEECRKMAINAYNDCKKITPNKIIKKWDDFILKVENMR